MKKKPAKKKRIFSTNLERIFIPAYMVLFLGAMIERLFYRTPILDAVFLDIFVLGMTPVLLYVLCYDWFESLFYPPLSSKKPYKGEDVEEYLADLKEKPWWVRFRSWNALDKKRVNEYWENYSGLHMMVVEEVKDKLITPEAGRDILVDLISFSDAAAARQKARKEAWAREDEARRNRENAAKKAKRKPARKKPAKKVAKKSAKKPAKKAAKKKTARKEKS